ncbi:Palmitoyltransferase ZDHHC7 [Seminavis robusta]|uniref:Palmitoyltransferase n=1 Tax=Seminavis robusta TaxID=568900 RepID=A0A9N8E5Q3_9STRA|nr:Palmitoyltransferase ZDHHC7 [Seminavis robusta]|eukprot:Sro648_g181080.1 Palmitoyltransferase ZDHHC7 (393) ;mRNA; f:32820-34314
MSTTTAQRRKGVPKAPGSAQVDLDALSPAPANNGGPVVAVATVRRRKFGTSPFDESWLNVDCCGLVCALVTYSLHFYAVYTICFVMIPPWMSVTDENKIRTITATGRFHQFAFTAVALMACLSHFYAMTTNPGAVPPDAKPVLSPEESNNATNGSGEEEKKLISTQKKGMRLCRRCNAFKPRRAHHCSVCRRCIIKMDHHCPWVNNCVGIGNHKYFLLFVFYTFLSCAYTITMLISWFVICMRHNPSGHSRHARHGIACLDSPTQLLNLLGLVVEAVLFGMFTSCMMVDQSDVISSKMTHIDRLKGGGDVGVPSLGGVAEVFGVGPRGGGHGGNSSRFRFDWFSPFAKVIFPPNVRDDIMGFCRPCSKVCSTDKETELAPQRGMVRSVAEIV